MEADKGRKERRRDRTTAPSSSPPPPPPPPPPKKTTPEVSSLPSARTLQAMRSRMPPDYQIIMAPPFSDLSKIDENVFLTGIGGMTKENIRDNNITCIVNATFEAPNLRQEGIEAVRIAVDDVPTEDISPFFDLAADKIYEHARRGGKSIVHCVAGVSRSAALTIAYLIKYKKMTLHDAFNLCRERRVVIRPNNGFFRQLIEYEKKILGKASVRMAAIEREQIVIEVPDFFETEHPRAVIIEAIKTKAKMAHARNIQQQAPPAAPPAPPAPPASPAPPPAQPLQQDSQAPAEQQQQTEQKQDNVPP